MKCCSQCGNELPDNATSCPICGTAVSQLSGIPHHNAKSRTGLGAAALTLSICGFMTGIFKIGIILDAVAIVLAVLAFKKSKQMQSKTGLAVAGIIIATTSMILCLPFLDAMWPNVFREDRLDTSSATPKATIVVELSDENQTFENADELIEKYFENEVRNESIYHHSMLTASSIITKIDIQTKLITIVGISDWIEFAYVTLENGCQFSYNLENDAMKEFVTALSVGDDVILSGSIGEITRYNVAITGYNYYSETAYSILCDHGNQFSA